MSDFEETGQAGSVLLVEGVEKRLASGEDLACCRHEGRFVLRGVVVGSVTRVVVTLCHVGEARSCGGLNLWGSRISEFLLGDIAGLKPGCQFRLIEASAVQQDSLGALV